MTTFTTSQKLYMACIKRPIGFLGELVALILSSAIEGLYKAMKQHYEDAELRTAHGKAGRERVENHFSNDVVSKAWVEFYKEMLR